MSSLVIAVRLWHSLSTSQPLWPFPALYFLELLLLPALVALVTFIGRSSRTIVAAASAGSVASFTVLGAWTVGLFYLPVVLLLAASALTSRPRTNETLLAAGGAFFVGFVLQCLLMIAVIRLFL